MSTTSSAVELLRSLPSAEIEQKISELEAETAALKTLLRAARARERRTPKNAFTIRASASRNTRARQATVGSQ
jgi:hypothetical protein